MSLARYCTDDHSSAVPGKGHCPEHGYDGSVPAPEGYGHLAAVAWATT